MRLHHVAVVVSDLECSARFYEQVIGLEQGLRPDLGFPGLFYRLGEEQQLHLMQIDDPCNGHPRPEHGGRDHHFSLSIDSLDRLISRLDEADVPYTKSRSGRAAIFFRDPDGNAIEIIQ